MSKLNEEILSEDEVQIPKREDEVVEPLVEDTPVEDVLPQKQRVSNASVDNNKFDWDAFEEEAAVDSAAKAEVETQYEQTLSKIIENDVVEGTVVSMNKREVIVNIGYKSEGVISISEFRYNPDLKVGDKVEVYVDSAEDKY